MFIIPAHEKQFKGEDAANIRYYLYWNIYEDEKTEIRYKDSNPDWVSFIV